MYLFPALLLVGCNNQPFMVESDVAEGDEGCGNLVDADGAMGPDFAEALEPSGCQYRITAVGEDLRLLLDVPLFADVLTEGSGSATYTLPDEAVRLTVEVGCDLDAGWCGEVGTATIFHTSEPTAGTVTVSTTRDDTRGTEETLATVTFEGVTFEDAYGEPVTMDPLTWTDVRLHGMEE